MRNLFVEMKSNLLDILTKVCLYIYDAILFPRWRILPNEKTTSTADEISKGKTLMRRTLT